MLRQALALAASQPTRAALQLQSGWTASLLLQRAMAVVQGLLQLAVPVEQELVAPAVAAPPVLVVQAVHLAPAQVARKPLPQPPAAVVAAAPAVARSVVGLACWCLPAWREIYVLQRSV